MPRRVSLMKLPSSATPGYLVWRLAMKWSAACDRAVAPMGLTQAQYALMASLYGLSRAGGRPSQRELADVAGLDPIFVSKLARTLENRGLLRRDTHPSDSRAVQLSLTELGIQAVVPAIAAVQALHHELTAPLGGMSSARTTAFTETMRILLGAADGDQGPSPAAPDPSRSSHPSQPSSPGVTAENRSGT